MWSFFAISFLRRSLLFPAGPVAALASAGWLWAVLHPSSHSLASCLVALAAVAADYGALSKDISRGRVQPGAQQQQQSVVRHCCCTFGLRHA
jgi:hypothetical protein